MECTHCGLLLPARLLVMRCPRCERVLLVQHEPSRSRERNIEIRGTEIASKKLVLPQPTSLLGSSSYAHAPSSPRARQAPEISTLRVAREITSADVMGYLRTKSIMILLSLCVLLLILFCCLAEWVHLHPTWFIDVAITKELQRFQTVWIDKSMKFISMPGDVPYLLMAIVYLSAVLFWVLRHRLEAIIILLVFEVSIHLNPLVKSLVNRPRPTAMKIRVIEATHGASFPSGHVMSYVAFWGLLFLLCVFVLKRKSWWLRGVMLISALFVVLVGPSRVYLGDHWATDVLGAYLLEGGLICLALILYLELKDLSTRFQKLWKQGMAKLT